MRIVEIRSEPELQQLRSSWEALLRGSTSDTIFITWEWMTAWWQAYGAPGELRIFAAFDDEGVLRGLAPLRSRPEKRYGQTVHALRFIGDGSFDSDYLDVIAASGYEERVLECFWGHWAEELRRGTILLLNEIPDTSRFFPLLGRFSESKNALWTASDVPCATVFLPGSWDEYLAALRPRFRTKIRSVLTALEQRPEIRFGQCASSGDVHRLLPILFDLHQRRWAEEGKPGVFRSEKKREFYAVLSERLLERGWLAFTWLEFKGQVLACQYGFRYRDTYYQLQEGYESDSGHWNVGIGLRAWCIRKFIAEGVREYDFLGGVGRHKTDWGAQVKHSKCIEIATRNPRNLLFSHGAQYEARAREAIARMLPKKLLALRKARLAATPLNVEASTAQTGRFSTRQWAAKAAASVYCHSGLPTLTRRVRSRYELSMDGDGAVLRRRRQPSGRIFCYHRVNDNNDPFFPATPTKVFENEIRYAARHYRVVSLTEMLSCLDAGSPAEPLIAVTFDDGYRDNFENALPILERYGVPSTIFLATGIIDSAECLWFEQMADCLKNTSREFIDLELDIPRRFWLRTERERLNANLRILGLLRNTPDIIRRQRLEEIVKCLPFDGPRKPAEMLSWDQIRRMKASRVDFGGHTVTHPFLSRATPEQACWEVSECKRRIEEETQSSVDYFAYPNGQAEDFAGHDRDLLRHAGYRAAVTTLWGVNYQATERMQLRRSGPWDSDPAMFASRLDWYQLRNE